MIITSGKMNTGTKNEQKNKFLWSTCPLLGLFPIISQKSNLKSLTNLNILNEDFVFKSVLICCWFDEIELDTDDWLVLGFPFILKKKYPKHIRASMLHQWPTFLCHVQIHYLRLSQQSDWEKDVEANQISQALSVIRPNLNSIK